MADYPTNPTQGQSFVTDSGAVMRYDNGIWVNQNSFDTTVPNFYSQNTPPTGGSVPATGILRPLEPGDKWYNPAADVYNVYVNDGTSLGWRPVTAAITLPTIPNFYTGSTEPTNASVPDTGTTRNLEPGDKWHDETTDLYYVYSTSGATPGWQQIVSPITASRGLVRVGNDIRSRLGLTGASGLTTLNSAQLSTINDLLKSYDASAGTLVQSSIYDTIKSVFEGDSALVFDDVAGKISLKAKIPETTDDRSMYFSLDEDPANPMIIPSGVDRQQNNFLLTSANFADPYDIATQEWVVTEDQEGLWSISALLNVFSDDSFDVSEIRIDNVIVAVSGGGTASAVVTPATYNGPLNKDQVVTFWTSHTSTGNRSSRDSKITGARVSL